MVVHPVHGTAAYPVTFFTNAPAEVLQRALTAISDLAPSFGVLSLSHAAADAGALLTLRSVCVYTPEKARLLIDQLSFSVAPGQHTLISGPNGAGKSTLLRVLCDLHPLGSGSKVWGGGLPACPLENPSLVMFSPQKALPAPGPTLHDQISYPGTDHIEHATLPALLTAVGLSHLLDRISSQGRDERWHDARDWGQELSPGELQRLCIARVLFRRPRVALLDEPTSAMSDDAAGQLFQLLHDAGVTCVTVGQETVTMRGLHRQHLRLGTGGADGKTWEIDADLCA